MYSSHWGLREMPFHKAHDVQSFYQSPTHEEALARLHFLVEQHRRLGLLLGPEGSGKSLLLEILSAQLRRRGPVVASVNLTGTSGDEMLWSLAGQFGRNLDRCETTPMLWRALSDRLAAFRYQQVDAVILIDDADQAANSVVPHLLRLAKLEPTPQPRLTLILAGDPRESAASAKPCSASQNSASTWRPGGRTILPATWKTRFARRAALRTSSRNRRSSGSLNCRMAFRGRSACWRIYPWSPARGGT